METGPWFKVSSNRLEKPRLDLCPLVYKVNDLTPIIYFIVTLERIRSPSFEASPRNSGTYGRRTSFMILWNDLHSLASYFFNIAPGCSPAWKFPAKYK